MMSRPRPIILISCSHTLFEVPGIGSLRHQAVFERYVDAVSSAMDSTPLLLPALHRQPEAIRDYARLADGILLTGDASNIAPELYGGVLSEASDLQDVDRDETVLPLVRAAIAEGVPLLGICRGLQEINVALGGGLHQRVHEVPGRHNHRAPRDRSFPERYLPAHPLLVQKGSWLEDVLLARGIVPSQLRVNSLHGQAIDKLGQSVIVQATADDGTVEAIRVGNAPALTIGVQWHAEWYIQETPLHAAIFDEFRQACLKRHVSRNCIPSPEWSFS